MLKRLDGLLIVETEDDAESQLSVGFPNQRLRVSGNRDAAIAANDFQNSSLVLAELLFVIGVTLITMYALINLSLS